MPYSENKPRPRWPCFLLDQNFFKESIRSPPKKQSYQIIVKSIESLWRRRFFKFHYMLYSENFPHPRRPCFFVGSIFFKESTRGSPKEHSYQITMKSIEALWRRRLFKFHYMLYSEIQPRPRRPCFLSDQNFFKESKRGPPKEHSYQIIMKSIEPL